jgi:hypothetical protein
MNSVLRLRETEFSPVSDILNIAARGHREAETIADRYAQRVGFGYWELNFNDHAQNAPRLVRNRADIKRV